MKVQVSAGVIVYKIDENKEREYLLLLYPRGYWDFAKGHLEGQEDKLTAAIRELKEETNLKASILDNFEYALEYFFKDNKNRLVHKYVTLFLGEALTDNVILSQEHLNYQWLNFDQAINKLNFDNAKVALSKAEDFLKNRQC